MNVVWESNSLEQTRQLGAIIEPLIPNGTVVALQGTLGAGKTALVRAMAASNGENPDDVTSPTFVLIQEYTAGKRPMYHFDAYRIADDDEFLELGPEEYFDSQGVTFVEWAERVDRCLPASFLKILVEQIGDSSRRFTFSAVGAKLEPVIERIGQALPKNSV